MSEGSWEIRVLGRRGDQGWRASSGGAEVAEQESENEEYVSVFLERAASLRGGVCVCVITSGGWWFFGFCAGV